MCVIIENISYIFTQNKEESDILSLFYEIEKICS